MPVLECLLPRLRLDENHVSPYVDRRGVSPPRGRHAALRVSCLGALEYGDFHKPNPHAAYISDRMRGGCGAGRVTQLTTTATTKPTGTPNTPAEMG